VNGLRRFVCRWQGHEHAATMLPEDGWGLYAYSRLFCRRCDTTFEEPYPFAELADYNGRVHRGIVHTPEFAARMAIQQRYFDEKTLRLTSWHAIVQPPPPPPSDRL